METTTCSSNPMTSVDASELALVADLLAAMSPVEGGPNPGAQLSRTRSGRIWTIADGTTTVDVRGSGSIQGLRQPVWMTARCLAFAQGTSDHDGCRLAIEDRREHDGTVAASIDGLGCHARIDLPAQPPLRTLRPPSPDAVVAVVTTDMMALVCALRVGSLAPVGVPVSGPPTGFLEFGNDTLIVHGTDRRGVDLPVEVHVDAHVELHTSAMFTEVGLALSPLVRIGEHLPCGEVTLTFTRDQLWLVAGECRLVLGCDARLTDPDELESVVYLVGRVEGTGEPVLSVFGGCPVDGTIVWVESRPDDYGPLERIEEDHDIVWYAEPEVFGVSAVDDRPQGT